MIYIIIGTASFFFMLMMEVLALRTPIYCRFLISIVIAGVFCFALVSLALGADRWPIHPTAKAVAWILTGLFCLLLIYSLFIEVNFLTTNMGGNTTHDLVTTGTYALSRHPGVLWLFLALLSVFVAVGTKLLLAAAVVWSIADVLHVYVQDRYIFPMRFGVGYLQYQKDTPMLLPNRTSIKRCLETLPFRNMSNS